MLKPLFFIFACVASLLPCSATEQSTIVGLWKSRDQHSDKPRSLVAVYEYKDKYYGRMIATYDEDGKIKDTIMEQKSKATGVVGNPPYCGMDFVYNVKKMDDGKYEGKVIDPEQGKVYDAELWRDGTKLMFRGKLWIFGKTLPWPEASESDLPKGFSMSQIKSFVPVVPKPQTPTEALDEVRY